MGVCCRNCTSVSATKDGTTDDRCQWQIKGGRSYSECEISANKVKHESATRCGKARGGAYDNTRSGRQDRGVAPVLKLEI